MGHAAPLHVEELLALVSHLEIAHHIPGRIRLRIKLTGLSTLSKVDLEAVTSAIPGIQSVRVNVVARSAVIEYDSMQISPDIWTMLGQLRANPALKQEIMAQLIALST